MTLKQFLADLECPCCGQPRRQVMAWSTMGTADYFGFCVIGNCDRCGPFVVRRGGDTTLKLDAPAPQSTPLPEWVKAMLT